MRSLTIIVIIATCACALSSCMTVKEYQKVYLNDADMQLGARDIESFQISFESYREGASGANGGSSGGGCGCN